MAEYSMVDQTLTLDQALADFTVVQKSNGVVEFRFNKSIEIRLNSHVATPFQYRVYAKKSETTTAPLIRPTKS